MVNLFRSTTDLPTLINMEVTDGIEGPSTEASSARAVSGTVKRPTTTTSSGRGDPLGERLTITAPTATTIASGLLPNNLSARSECSLSPVRRRRRTLSWSAEPFAVSGAGDGKMVAGCPCCGFGADGAAGDEVKSHHSESARRQWMSGIHALSCSKTEPISCPIDGCAHVCSGRADLSAHLTGTHFPEGWFFFS